MLITLRRIVTCALLAVALAAAPAAANPLGHNGRIAFSRFDPLLGDSVLYTVDPDGTHERQLLHLGLGFPRWSPDSTRVAGCCGPAADGHAAATVVNADDPGDHVVLPEADPANRDLYCALWTADGTRLACEGFGVSDTSLNGVYTIRASDGGGVKRVTSNPDGNDQPGDYSPNGERLVISRFAPCCPPLEEFIAKSGLFVVNVNGTGARKVAPCCGSLGSWSPQGNEIVFSRHVTEDVHSSIWVVHADGTGLRQINVAVRAGQFPCGAPNSDPTAGGCFSPRWSPDGRKIVFVRGDPDRGLGSDIFTVDADGSHLTQLTHDGQDNNDPDWGSHPLAG